MSKELINREGDYRLILENINDLVSIVDTRFPYEFEYINESLWQSSLNYFPEDLIGKSFLKIVHKNFTQQIKKILEDGNDNNDFRMEVRIISKNGLLVWFNLKKEIFTDHEGKRKNLVILKEISQYKQLKAQVKNEEESLNVLTKSIPEIKFWRLFTPKKYEEALMRSYEILELVINSIPQYIFWKDIDLHYLGCNSNYASLVGINSPERIIGKKNDDIFSDDDKVNTLNQKEREILNEGVPSYHKVEKWRDSDGSELIIDINRVPLKDSEERIVGILTTFQDITEKIEKDKKLIESEQKYRNLIETSSVGILEVDLTDDTISYINPKLVEILGFKGKEKVSKSEIKKYIPLGKLKKEVQSNGKRELEFRIYDCKRNLKWISGKYVNHYNSEGKLVTLRFWLEDITERKKYEDLITELNINFLNFGTNIQENIKALLNTCKKLLNANSVAYVSKYKKGKEEFFQLLSTEDEKFSLDRQDFEDQLFLSTFFKKEHDFLQYYDLNKIIKKKYSKTDPFIKDNQYKCAIGKKIISDDTFNSIICCFFENNIEKSSQNQLVLFLIADAIEIEQKRWEMTQHLRKQNIRLQEMDNLKTELFSRVSHELKTPLISIKGYTELMITIFENKLNDEMHSILKNINKGCRKLEKIVNRLLESSRLDQKELELNRTPSDLSLLIMKCINEMEGYAESRDHQIESDIHNELKVEIDKLLILKVLENLLSNAIKYTPPGGKINIESKKTSNKIKVLIKDTGIGFTEEEKKYLFKKFGKIERWGRGWDVEIGGTGLGLYIAKKIIELHGGKIWMNSKGRNKGSMFGFSLRRT